MKKVLLVIVGIVVFFWAIGKLGADPVKKLEKQVKEAAGTVYVDSLRYDLLKKEYQEALGVKTKITENIVTLKNEASEL